MEKVPLNVQLDHLATADAILKPYFYGTVACDQLPHRPIRKEPRGYIMNTDNQGQSWLALWTHSGNVRGDGQLRLTFGVFLKTTKPLQDWLKSQWKYVIYNEQSRQSTYSKSCGDYALFYLKDGARSQA